MKGKLAFAASMTAVALLSGCSSGPELPTLDGPGPADTELVIAKDPSKIPPAVGRMALSVVRMETVNDSGSGAVVYYKGKKVIFGAAHVAFAPSRCDEYVIRYQPTSPSSQGVVGRVAAQTNVVGGGGPNINYVLGSYNNGTDETELIPAGIPDRTPALKLPENIFDVPDQRVGDVAYIAAYTRDRDPAKQPPTIVGADILGTIGNNTIVAVNVGSVVHSNSGAPVMDGTATYEGAAAYIVADSVPSEQVRDVYGVQLPASMKYVEVVAYQTYLASNLDPAMTAYDPVAFPAPPLVRCNKK